jgi:hypothetical protein
MNVRREEEGEGLGEVSPEEMAPNLRGECI